MQNDVTARDLCDLGVAFAFAAALAFSASANAILARKSLALRMFMLPSNCAAIFGAPRAPYIDEDQREISAAPLNSGSGQNLLST